MGKQPVSKVQRELYLEKYDNNINVLQVYVQPNFQKNIEYSVIEEFGV